ncbi:MAG: DUF615 domain-containing protein [Desulfomicrobium escambiense]|nr:DUF615 domain-containing protein [Desulfomicrobium escambiense]
MQKEAEGYPDRIKEVSNYHETRMTTPFMNRCLPSWKQPKSKTRLKKEMIELQKLGEHLVTLPAAYLKKAGILPELL